MLLTITPIGSTPTDVAAAADAYVEYLCGGAAGASPAPVGDGHGAVGYYAESTAASIVDGAGWWSGGGASLHGLGERAVDRDVFATLLHGRHPTSGERLVTAQGSAGRVHLKAGTPTRLINGQPVWSFTDAEAALGSAVPCRAVSTDALVVDSDGSTYLSVSSMRLLLEAAGRLKPQITIEDLVAGEQRVPARAVAEAINVTRQHLNQLCVDVVSGAVDDKWGLAPTKKGRTWMVDRDAALAWNDEREPASVRVGYDATLTTEKSLSVLALCVPAATDEAVAALAEANQTALAWLEMNASTGRSKGERISSYGHTVASFMHSTSRNDDPFLHVHNVVLNAVTDANGTGRALDATGLYAQAPAAAALATATMRRRLSDNLGVDWRLSGRDTWEIAGIDDSVLEGFSTRSAEIESALAELLAPDTALDAADSSERDTAAAGSRRHKTGRSANELMGEWSERATAMGLDAAARSAVTGRRDRTQTGPLDLQARDQLWRWLSSPEGVCANSASVRLGDVFWAIANWAPQGRLALLDADQITHEAERWLSSQRVVTLDMTHSVAQNGRSIGAATEPTWTTAEMIELQAAISNAWAEAHNGNGLTASRSHIAAAIAEADLDLSDEQRTLVRCWVGSGNQIQAAVGRPGTGKTTTMSTAARAWEKAGHRVVGAAIKGEAARLLGVEAHIESETLASYLAAWRRGRNVLDANTVFIVDEASTLSDWDLAATISMCDEVGATLRLIGDPAQHSSVDAGGSWAAMLERFAIHTPELVHQRRLTNETEQRAAELVRGNDFAGAFDALDSTGSIATFDSWSDACVPLVQRWWKARHNNASHPMVERTNERRRILNSVAQSLRHASGEISEPVPVGPKHFAVGDEIVAKEPNRKVGNDRGTIRNGSTGTIVSIDAASVTVDFDSLGELAVPLDFCARTAGIDLAYAQTSYSIQGATNNVSTSVIAANMSAAELLVNITRGRHQNMVFAVGDDSEFSPEAPDDLTQSLADSVRVVEQTRVDDLDRDAAAVHASGLNGRRLADLHENKFEDLSSEESVLLNRIRTSRHQQLAMRARLSQLPTQLTDVLGDRPTVPILAHRWEQTATSVLAYWDTYRPRAVKHHDPNLVVLGDPGTAPDAQVARDELAAILDNYQAAVSAEQTGAQL